MLLHLSAASDCCGAKAKMIYCICSFLRDFANITIPKSRIISTHYYDDKIRKLTSVDEIRGLVQSEVLPSIRSEFGYAPLVIRSSATCEDSALFSGAGVYDSFLNLTTDEQIVSAIIKVYESFQTPNAHFYASYNSVNYCNESIAILIQELAPVKTSGVLFTIDPITNANDILIEYTTGLGDSVVSGNSTTTKMRISKNNTPSTNELSFLQLIEFSLKYENQLGFPIDVEWGFDDNYVYIFQVRQVIKSIQSRKCCESASEERFVVSKGIGIGQTQSISSEDASFDKIIIRDEKFDITDILKLLNSRGFVINTGGRLSHFANLIREFSVPCIFIDNTLNIEQDIYVLDGYRNVFKKMTELEPEDKNRYIAEYLDEIRELFSIHNYRFGIMGIQSVLKSIRYESVVFDVSDEICTILSETCRTKKVGLQKIYTYDFKNNSLFQQRTIGRIQLLNEECRVQFKTIEIDTNYVGEKIQLCDSINGYLEQHNHYRTENEYVLTFVNYDKANAFLTSLGLVNTGYQERYMTCYMYDDCQYKLIKWPRGAPYLGIECHSQYDFSIAISRIKVNSYQCVAIDGKQIFDRLGLTISDCSFGGSL